MRTLTFKSVMKVGKFPDKTVSDLILMKKTRYLRWCYYNMGKINFIPEVLEKIYITDEYVIDKPSINKLLGEKLNEELEGNMTEKSLSKIKAKAKKNKKKKFEGFKKADKKNFKKGNLARRNHGHK